MLGLCSALPVAPLGPTVPLPFRSKTATTLTDQKTNGFPVPRECQRVTFSQVPWGHGVQLRNSPYLIRKWESPELSAPRKRFYYKHSHASWIQLDSKKHKDKAGTICVFTITVTKQLPILPKGLQRWTKYLSLFQIGIMSALDTSSSGLLVRRN